VQYGPVSTESSRRRRVRGRALVGAAVIALVGGGLAVGLVIAGHNDGGVRERVASKEPATTTTATTKPATTTSIAATGDPKTRFELDLMTSLSFVDAKVGFAASEYVTPSTGLLRSPIYHSVVRTDDGGRTWRWVSELDPNYSLHFENASDGVAWGDGPMTVTRDGGRHWSELPGSPEYVVTAWSGGRIWGVPKCGQEVRCGTRPLLVSDDIGLSWRPYGSGTRAFLFAGTYEDRIGIVPAMVVTSRSTVYVLEAKDDENFFPWRLASTHDGGATWRYDPVPCESDRVFLASTDQSLLLECRGDPVFLARVFVSIDRGRSWTERSGETGDGRYLPQITSFGSIYFAETRYASRSSSDGGASWQDVPIRTGASGVGFYPLPGVGVWATVLGFDVAEPAGRIWFSADGLHWEQRARSLPFGKS
jgi:hypothetical protein